MKTIFNWKYLCGMCTAASAIGSFGFYYSSRQPLVLPNVKHECFRAILEAKDVKSKLLLDNISTIAENVGIGGWCVLALEGSHAFRAFQPKIIWTPRDERDASMYLLELDRELYSTCHWDSSNICSEEDLDCQEMTSLRRSSQKRERLLKFLRSLLYQSEVGSCDKLIKGNIMYVIFQLLEKFHHSDVQLLIITLKILSNIALKSKTGAQLICETPLLQLLHSMIHKPFYEEEEVLAHKICINTLHTLGVLGAYRLPSGIYELYRPPLNVPPLIDIVFIHGLRGTVFRTWRQRDDPTKRTTLFWPKEWLPKDIAQPIRVLALDYSTSLLQLSTVMETISVRSKKIQDEFENAEIGSRPVLFVCHSMGGLLLKHMLINNENLVKQTIGILFMSTPHRGSPLAGYAFELLHPSDDLRLLRSDSKTNQILDVEFKKITHEIPVVVTVLESRKTPIFGTQHFIVPNDSGIIETGAVYHVDAHHHHICKPESQQSTIYHIVSNFVKDSLRYVVSKQKG